MAHSNGALKRIASSKASPNICQTCLLGLRQIRLASTAITSSRMEESTIEKALPSTSIDSPTPATHKIKASVLLSRPPMLTRDLTPFEKAYFLYQRRLNERLALPFTRYFYYPRGTPGDVEWKRKVKERRTPARDIGLYNAYSREEGWHDELLVGAQESEPEHQMEALVKDAEVEDTELEGEEGAADLAGRKKKEKVERPMPRVTEADRMGDLKSLNRALTRTLYLVVKEGGKRGRWGFPSSSLLVKESLHTAAERILIQCSGVNMNTWVVGNMPIGHRIITYPQKAVDKEKGTELLGEKVFFMKARIMAGQANLASNKLGLKDFRWLAKEEVQKELHSSDWNSVKTLLLEL